MAANVERSEDVLLGKVFNFVSTRGWTTISELLQPPAPLASKISTVEAAKSWARDNLAKDKRFSVETDCVGEVTRVKVTSNVRMCAHYVKSGRCPVQGGCKYWHICKEYVEGKCDKICRTGKSHDFHDKGNDCKTDQQGFGKLGNGSVRRIVSLNLPRVCPAYAQGFCDEEKVCECLHLCPAFVQKTCRKCDLSHKLRSDHNMPILKTFGFDASLKEMYILCNVLLPKNVMVNSFKSQDVTDTGCDNSGEVAKSGFASSPWKQVYKTQTGGQRLTHRSFPNSLDLDYSLREEDEKDQNNSDVSEDYLGSIHRDESHTGGAKDKPGIHKKSRPRKQPRATKGGGKPRNWAGRGRGQQNTAGQKNRSKPGGGSATHWALPSGKDAQDDGQDDDEASADGSTGQKRNPRTRGAKKPGHWKAEGSDATVKGDGPKCGNPPPQHFDTKTEQGCASAGPYPSPHNFNAVSQKSYPSGKQSCELGKAAPSSKMLSRGLSESGPGKNPGKNPGTSPADPEPVEISEKRVFECICKEHNCSVKFSDIAKRAELFPNGAQDAEAWFREEKRKYSFILTENSKGELLEVSAFSQKLRLCFSGSNCIKEVCSFFHVCKQFIAGSCKRGATCRHDHEFRNDKDGQLISSLKILSSFTEDQLLCLFRASTPHVCADYNQGSCHKGKGCAKVHVCSAFVRQKCQGCGLDHEAAYETPHTKVIAEKFKMSGLTLRRVIIAQPPPQGQVAGEKYCL